MILAFAESLRPRQWTKNLLVLAGVVFAQRWDSPPHLVNALAGFLVFCLLSGVVYVWNDIADIAQDRQHPKKSRRPIASGRISPAVAGALAGVLAVASLTAAFVWLPMAFAWMALLYLVLTTAYSFLLKHVVILDILLLAIGFVLRAVAGVEVIQLDPAEPVQLTSYFLMTTLFLALFLAAGKRRAELVMLGDEAGNHRRVLSDYSTSVLDTILTVATTGTLFSYILWTTQGQFARAAATSGRHDSLLLLTIPFVLYGVFRYLWLIYHRHEGGAPESVFLEDRPILVAVVLWAITTVAVLTQLD